MICPLCNGLDEPTYPCPTCGAQMEDAGALEDFRGPYAPYEEHTLMAGADTVQGCTHLFRCPACGRDKRVVIPFCYLFRH